MKSSGWSRPDVPAAYASVLTVTSAKPAVRLFMMQIPFPKAEASVIDVDAPPLKALDGAKCAALY